MDKKNVLVVELSGSKANALVKSLGSEASRKILDELGSGSFSEEELSEKLSMPLSTVHYHVQRLVEGGLVVSREFRYSKRGREIHHYTLANQYIVIAPRGSALDVSRVLPVAGIALGLGSLIIGLFSRERAVAESAALFAEADVMMKATPVAASVSSGLPAWAWVLIGGGLVLATVGFYALMTRYAK